MQQVSFAQTHYSGEMVLPAATARIMDLYLDAPTNRVFRRESHYWLDMCLTPRPEHARACYLDRWGPHRFERLGEVFLVPPGESLHIRSDRGGNQASVVCEIAAAEVDRWMDGRIEWNDRRLEAGLDIAHPHIRQCMFRLAEEIHKPGPGSAELGSYICGQIAIELARYCEAIAEGPISGGLASWRLRIIDQRLQIWDNPPTLEELAGLCSISVRQLSRGFRASRGCTIGDYTAQLRVQMAKRMLAESSSIKSVAFALGFASPSSFSYAFRRATGASPRVFRQRQLRKRA